MEIPSPDDVFGDGDPPGERALNSDLPNRIRSGEPIAQTQLEVFSQGAAALAPITQGVGKALDRFSTATTIAVSAAVTAAAVAGLWVGVAVLLVGFHSHLWT